MTVQQIEPPAEISLGTVEWWTCTDVNDGPDPAFLPDFVPPRGYVSFVSSVGKLLGAGATPFTMIRDVIIGVIDEEGYLCTPDPSISNPDYPLGIPATRGLLLVANDDPDLNPQGSVYNVSCSLKSGRTGKTLKYPEPHQLTVLTGVTVDLSTA